MNSESLKQVATEMSLQSCSGKSSQNAIIHAIQMEQGSEPCFLSDKRYKCNEICEWRDSCQKLKAVWLR